MRTIRMRT
uniref:Uncharacterized protein n=1 Tax=Anguilla anguilla TaxID=7936 RepID=A0A0E9UXU6_ANGAN